MAYSILGFGLLKWAFPYPNFLPDSYSYLEAAFTNRGINMWPIGYSAFLRLFSSFTRSDTALVLCQYLLLQSSILYLCFTIRYLLRPGKWLFAIIVGACILNPLTLFVSNFVSSDAIFAAISIIWLTQLFWIVCRPGLWLILRHALILVTAFTVRYNALYYPLISLSVILLAAIPLSQRAIGAAAILLLLGCFAYTNVNKYHRLTGQYQFSAFAGWQMASNALFAYGHIHPDTTQRVPREFQALHRMVNTHMDSLSHLAIRPDNQLGVYYLWDDKSPLKKYLFDQWNRDSTTDWFTRWASIAPTYSAYGTWLIAHNPGAYLSHYIWPNLVSYYAPPTEFLSIYNMGSDSVSPMAKLWFDFKKAKIYSRLRELPPVAFCSVLLAITNLVFIMSFIGFWLLNGFRSSPVRFSKIIRLVGCIWICNLLFSVLASPVVLRYQIFPMIITFVSAGMLLEYLIRASQSRNPKTSDNDRSDSSEVMIHDIQNVAQPC